MEMLINSPALAQIPRQPGCYLFRNKFHQLIYIGKSKCLIKRIKQHLNSTDPTDYKHIEMMKELHSIELIVTDTETNALILECQLIKRHKPKFNSQLKNEKTYPFIRLNPRQPYPTLTITEQRGDDGAVYSGSFYNKSDALATLTLICDIWRIPACGKESFTHVQRPCLNFHLNKCCAPCGGQISPAEYQQRVGEIVKCLNGHFRLTLTRLKAEMGAAAAELDFERAARIRDSIHGLDRLKKKQLRLCTDLENKEVYLFFKAFGETCFSLFFIKNGVTLNRVDFPDMQATDKARLTAFVDANKKGIITVTDGAFLTVCLLEIGAQKLFMPVSRKSDGSKTVTKLEKGISSMRREGK